MFRTMPLAAGSPPAVKTIGMVCVCCCITLVAVAELVTGAGAPSQDALTSDE